MHRDVSFEVNVTKQLEMLLTTCWMGSLLEQSRYEPVGVQTTHTPKFSGE